MVNVKELQCKREELKYKIQVTETMLKNESKKNLQHYKEFTQLYFNIDRKYDYKKYIFDQAIASIESITEHNKKQIKVCISQIFSTADVLYCLEDLIKADHLLQTFKKNIIDNKNFTYDGTVTINVNELYVSVNLNKLKIKFMTQNDVYSEINIIGPKHPTKHDNEYLSTDFCINIDLDNLNYHCLITKLEALIEYLDQNIFSLEELEGFNSYLTYIKRGDIIIFRRGCLKSVKETNDCKLLIKRLNTIIVDKYECKKMRGLLVSYFYAISTGLQELFYMDDYYDVVDMYYVKWIKNARQ